MFGHRVDGKRVKGMGIIEKAEPFFMPMRIDAVNYIKAEVPCTPLDEFIAREKKNGISYSYMHLAIATIVRIMYLRPKHNRFIVNGVVYQRNKIMVSMDIKKKLADDGENLTLKFEFTGKENIEEIKNIVDSTIAENLSKGEDATTKFIKHLTWTPAWVLRFALAIFRFMDKHGMLTKGMIKASPFHTSCFFTNLKSIKLGYIYHHLYNFGTTSMFVSMGKERMMPVVENNRDLKVAKMAELGISLDERVADGYYMAKTLRLMKDLLSNPDNLKEKMPDDGTISTKIKKRKKKTKATKTTKAKSKNVKTKKEKKSRVKVKKIHSHSWLKNEQT